MTMVIEPAIRAFPQGERSGRIRLMEAAFTLFRDEGFAQTSIDRVVAQARVSKRTFYENFRSKHHLLEDVISGFTASAFAAAERVARDFGDPRLRLLTIARLMDRAANSADSVAMMRLQIAEADKLDGLPQRLHRQAEGLARELMRAPLAEIGVSEPDRVAALLFDLLVVAPLHRRLVGLAPDGAGVEQALRLCLGPGWR